MKCQVAVELLVIMALMAIVFLSLFVQYQARETAIRDSETRLAADRNAAVIALAANSLLPAPSGAWVTVRPDSSVAGRNYSIALRGRRVEVSWEGGSASRPLLTSNFTGSIAPGALTRIRKTDGGIVFETP